MKRTDLSRLPCSIARTSNLLGDWWTPLVLREAFSGVRRFDEFAKRLGIGRNVLTQRLQRLTNVGILTRVQYQTCPDRHEYRLTDMGRDLFGVLAAMIRWGDDWLVGPEGAPIELVDSETRQVIRPLVVDEHTGEALDPRRIAARPGPGFPERSTAPAGRDPNE